MPEDLLEALTRLEHADEEIGAALTELDLLVGELDSIRATTAELQAFEERLPAERERLSVQLDRARAEVLAAHEALAEAEEAVRIAERERTREAEHFLVRARDRVSVAERRAVEAGSRREELEHEVGERTTQGDALHARARKLAAELGRRPQVAGDAGREPAAGLDGLRAWGEVARAALFVARGQLAGQREGVIRQANEIGAIALGEPLTSVSAAVVTRRVRQSLR